MNVTFNGYLALTCIGCHKQLTVESDALKFEQDASPEAEEDDFIRYTAQIDRLCPTCPTKLHVMIDVWEYPEAVANYAYYDEEGARDIQCEFNIEHYFDDESVDGSDQPAADNSDESTEDEEGDDSEPEDSIEFDGEGSAEDDTSEFDHSQDYDRYVDQYDTDD